MAKVAINPRDLTATVPDGPVNRHVQVVFYLDTDTGAITGEPALDVARHEARNSKGELPAEQIVGSTAASSAELDDLREQVKTLQAQLSEQDNGRHTDPTDPGV